MKVTWEEGDIKAGRRFGRIECKEKWMIGYRFAGSGSTEFTIISLVDGMVNSMLKSRQDVADFLNRAEDLPLELINESWRNELESE